MRTNYETAFNSIEERIEAIDPVAYGKTRNFINGDVTYLSPYISRGVISTKQVLHAVLDKGYRPNQIEKFIQELAWRDYWQQIWIAKSNAIDSDLKHPQPDIEFRGVPTAIIKGETGIEAIDTAIIEFYRTGYLHNHVRMYIAAICTNVAKCHWLEPAQWMYYYLWDGDWASNALSWQWVAGSNSNKKYIANQGNINKYCNSNQRGTFLDISYEELATIDAPKELAEIDSFTLTTELPEGQDLHIDSSLPTLIYNFYNLDPNWKADEDANRILLLEPSHFTKYPVSSKSIEFALGLSNNITGIQVFIGEFQEMMDTYHPQDIFFKSHPTNRHYQGTQVDRDWMFSVTGYFSSFFSFWKKCKKELTW